MSTVGLYVPGSGVLYRTSAWVKLLTLLVAGTGLIVAAEPRVAVAALVVAVVSYPLVGLPLRHAGRVLRVLWPFLVAIGVFQGLFGDWQTGVRVCAQLAALVLLANVVTLTTRVQEMLDLVQRMAGPLGRFGDSPARVALVLA